MSKRCWYYLTGKRGGCQCHSLDLKDLWWLQTVKEAEGMAKAKVIVAEQQNKV